MIVSTKTPKILVAQLGARKHYQEPILFHQWGFLDRLYTDYYCQNSVFSKTLKQNFFYQKLPNILKKGLERHTPHLATAEIAHFPQLALKYNISLKKASLIEKSKINIQTGKEFCHNIIKSGLNNIDVIYGFDGACLELFEYAKTTGIKCVLDQTIAERSLIHKLLIEEENLWSGWSKQPFQVYPGDLELVKRQQKEQQLADCIICGSSFVKDSLISKGIESNKIVVVPLGNLQDRLTISKSDQHSTNLNRSDGLKILFAGSVGLRKGIQYLLQTLKQLKGKIPFTCKIAGLIEINSEIIQEYEDVAQFLGLVPRSQMKQLYNWADVFVLPSICEGSAMVTYEAINSQLPILTTYNTGSIVRDGIDGFIVPIRDSQEIVRKLKLLYFNTSMQLPEQSQLEYYRQINFEAQNKLKNCLLAV